MCAILLCVLPFAGAAEPTKEELAKKELEKLQGTWKLVAVEWRGEKIDVAGKVPESFDMVISGSKMTVGKYEATLVIDPTTDPKLLDMNYTKEKVTHESIYRIEGDTLTLCWRRGIGPAKDRPIAFKTDDKTDYEIRVYKREIPKK